MTAFDFLQASLAEKQKQSLYRHRLCLGRASQSQLTLGGKPLIDFASNDYLGLSQEPRLRQAAEAALAKYGVGSGASHLISGHFEIHDELEETIARWLNQEDALLFSTGYMANLSLLRALGQGGSLLLQDKLNHASLIDAGQFKDCESRRYLHCDINSLAKKLERLEDRKPVIVTDGVFSMDGDLAPLPEIMELAEAYQAVVILDDAHGLGVLGRDGAGCADHFDISQCGNLAVMGTMGKALGCFGAFVAGPKVLIDYLTQFARPFIYTTALPPAIAAAALEAIKIIRDDNVSPQSKLQTNIESFRELALRHGLKITNSNSAIQPLIIGDNATCLAVGEALREAGILVATVRPPTVPAGTARLRITLSARHEYADLEHLCATLTKVLANNDIVDAKQDNRKL